jgi:hypothetical protein
MMPMYILRYNPRIPMIAVFSGNIVQKAHSDCFTKLYNMWLDDDIIKYFWTNPFIPSQPPVPYWINKIQEWHAAQVDHFK